MEKHRVSWAFLSGVVFTVLLSGKAFSQATVVSAKYWSIVVPKATALDLVDMGQVSLGGKHDSTLTGYLKAGSYPVRIDAITVRPPFYLVDTVPHLPFVIPKNDSILVKFRFIPTTIGNFSDSVIIETQAETLNKRIIGEGMDSQGSAILRIDTIRAKAGELVEVPVYLRNVKGVKLNTIFHTELRFNATLLSPTYATPKGTVANGERHIAHDVPWTQSGKEGVLTTLRFIAMLGNADGTPLFVENSFAIGGQVAVAEVPGYFLLTDVCREGGTRLFNSGGSVTLFQNRPNPFNAMTVIEYEVIENGPTKLVVMDVYGRNVKTLVDAVIVPGRYSISFDAGALASGTYVAVLQTPTARKFKRMEVAK
jgi:hypothetical protein